MIVDIGFFLGAALWDECEGYGEWGGWQVAKSIKHKTFHMTMSVASYICEGPFAIRSISTGFFCEELLVM